MSKRTQVWSCGGGVQSAAVAALIIQGRLPKPDLSFIIDTNREKSSTWAYMDGVLSPALKEIGVEVVRVDRSEFATVDLYSRSGESLLLPVFTNQSGEISKLPAYCSAEWKREVGSRWMRQQGLTAVDSWLGISTDEIGRVRAARREWLQYRYPLIFDVPMSRQDCIALVALMGWPTAPRSSCWMCPHMRDGEWRAMREESPGDFEKAVAMDRLIRISDPHAFLHDSCVPLDEVDFTENQMSFVDSGCAGGHCWV